MSNVIAISRARCGFERDISQCSLNHGGDPLTEFAFVCYIWQVNDPLSQISSLSSQIQSAFAAIARVLEILEEEEEIAELNPPKHIEQDRKSVV